MDISQLSYFIQVAHELHFARAAAKLGVTQPSLSRGIQTLERELGVTLLHRSNRWHVDLSAAGRVFLPEAEKILHQLKSAEILAKGAAAGRTGHLAIGAISSAMGKRAFVETLSVMQRRYSDVTVEVIDANSVELSAQIRERSLDVALLRTSPELAEDDGLVSEKLYDDVLAVVLPRQHRLAKAEHLSVADLSAEHFILVPARTSPAFHNYVCSFCLSRGGFTPMVTDEMSSSYAALHLVEAGLGITVVSSSYVGLFEDRLCYRKLSDFHPFLPVYGVYARDRESPLLGNFLSVLKENLAALPEVALA